MDKLEIAKAKELRALVVTRLYDFYEEDTTINTLKSLLRYNPRCTDKELNRALNYLSGTSKEFIEIKRNDEDFYASLIKLTPRGVNLAEGDIQDVGVDTGE